MIGPLRWAGRAALVAILVAFVVMTAYGTLLAGAYSFQAARDARLVVFAIAILVTAPGWLILALAARARGAPWAWVAFAAAWGAFPAVWLALLAGTLVDPVEVGRPTETLAPEVSSILVAPLVEEPAKLLGVLIAVAAAHRAGAALTVGMAAAIGGLAGMAFGIAEVAARIGAIVGELGSTDLSGVFVIDWQFVRQITELEFTRRFAFLGLTNHALFTALAGAGFALLLLRRPRLGLACFVGALGGHAVTNAVAGQIMASVVDVLAGGVGPFSQGAVPLLVAGWLGSVGASIVTEGWAAVLLIRILRRGRPELRRPLVA